MEKGPEKKKTGNSKFTLTAAAALLAVVLFAACLIGAAWAWYSSSVTSGANVITSANFDLTVNMGALVPNEGWYVFDGAEDFTVTLMKNGTGTGYCLIEAVPGPVPSEDMQEETASPTILYHTAEIKEGSYIFKISGAGKVKLTSKWGLPAGDGELIENGGTVNLTDPDTLAAKADATETPTPTPDATATAEPTETAEATPTVEPSTEPAAASTDASGGE